MAQMSVAVSPTGRLMRLGSEETARLKFGQAWNQKDELCYKISAAQS